MRTLLILIMALFCVGCASKQCAIVTKEVKIPVYQSIDIPQRDFPKLPVNSLNSKSSDKEVAIAFDKSIVILIQEVKYYRTVLNKINTQNIKK